MLEQLLAKDMGGLRESGLGVPDIDRNDGGEIGRGVPMGERRPGLKRRDAIGRRRQRLVIHIDQRGRILGQIAAVGHYDGDRLAHKAGFVFGEAIRHIGLLDRRARHQERHGLPLHRGRQIREGKDRVHARKRKRRALVEPADAGMGMRAAQNHRVEHAGQLDVVHKAAASGQEVRILLALDAGAEPSHQLCPLWLTRRAGRRQRRGDADSAE
jgi:hypothetical protein